MKQRAAAMLKGATTPPSKKGSRQPHCSMATSEREDEVSATTPDAHPAPTALADDTSAPKKPRRSGRS